MLYIILKCIFFIIIFTNCMANHACFICFTCTREANGRMQFCQGIQNIVFKCVIKIFKLNVEPLSTSQIFKILVI